MKRTLLAGAVAATLGLGIVAPAQAAPTPDEQLSASWLAGQVPDGGIFSTVQFGSEAPDHGLTVDVLVALSELETETAARDTLADALSQPEEVEHYTTGLRFDPGDVDGRYAGPLGKLTTGLLLAGRSVPDLVTELEGLAQPSGVEAGRLSDAFTPCDEGTQNVSCFRDDYSNVIGQSWGVRALARSASAQTPPTATYLAGRQCTDGSFTVTIDAGTCSSGDPDATAFALIALVEARDAGVEGLAEEIAAASANLRAAQADDGSFANPTPNTNTTGLAANALQKAGATDAAARAADWVVDKQVTTDNAAGSELASELGAIAFDDDALAAGRTDGITATTRDQWRRATAQAALALPAADLAVRAPRLAATGATETVEVSRLEADQAFEVTVGTVTVAGRADASGRGSVDVVLPETEGDVLVEVSSVSEDDTAVERTGSTIITLLGAAEFDVTVNPDVARPGAEVEVGFGGSPPADGEGLDLFVVPVEAVEDALADAGGEPTGPQVLSADQVDALDREGLEDAAVETLDVQEGETFEVEAPTEAGEYVVFVLSQVSDERGGAAALDVVAAEPAVTPGGLGGSGDGVGADASVLPNGGSPVTPWSLWLAVAATVFGAALVRFGLKRRAAA